jgi:tetratricopeptide (TPR) repeat protein
MRAYSWISGVAMALAVSACAIPSHQTDALLASRRDIADKVTIEDVPFVQQEKNFCGPASLAMAMGYAGNPVPVDTLASQSITPAKKGAIQADILGAARRNGMLAVEIAGLSSLLHEVEAGHPVLVLENLGLSWYPIWHYSVVTGYDLAREQVTRHSGSSQNATKDLRVFERCWQDSNYWGVVVLQPGELSAGAGELAHSVAAAALEQLGKTEQAECAYKAILKKWPSSLGALIGMGNLRDAAGDPVAAARFLSRAVKAYPESSIAWHNLAIAEGESGKRAKAQASAQRAMRLATPTDAPVFRQNLSAFL